MIWHQEQNPDMRLARKLLVYLLEHGWDLGWKARSNNTYFKRTTQYVKIPTSSSYEYKRLLYSKAHLHF
jgi:hypothetical protein